jgi:hypothetical protein
LIGTDPIIVANPFKTYSKLDLKHPVWNNLKRRANHYPENSELVETLGIQTRRTA